MIYLIQFFQILLSNQILVFDENLIEKSRKLYPLSRNKTFHVFNHGVPIFKETNLGLDVSKVNFGFFGRNMAYKNVNIFLNMAILYPNCIFHIYGSGYESLEFLYDNLIITNGFIENNKYYSAMSKMDYVVIPYKDISFSGIISDCLSLGKKMIVSEEVCRNYSNSNMILISEFSNPVKQDSKKMINSGWNSYSDDLQNIFYKNI